MLPKIASKYKKSDRGFYIDRMSERDPNFMVKETFGNLLSSEQKGFKPNIIGQVKFDKMKPRKPLILESSAKYAPNIYTYADSIKHALDKGRVPVPKLGSNSNASGKPHLFKGMQTM